MSPPSSGMKSMPSKQASSMKQAENFQMLADFQRNTWCYVPEDRIFHNHHCEILKSHIIIVGIC
jgi:hypothetical protein